LKVSRSRNVIELENRFILERFT
jgi:hypothetical protein